MFPQYQNYDLNVNRRINRRVYLQSAKKYSDATEIAPADGSDKANTFYQKINTTLLTIGANLKEASSYFYTTQVEQPVQRRGRQQILVEEIVKSLPQLNNALSKTYREFLLINSTLPGDIGLINYLPKNKLEIILKLIGDIDSILDKFVSTITEEYKDTIEYQAITEILTNVDVEFSKFKQIIRYAIQNYTPLTTLIRKPISYNPDIKPIPNKYL
jgi:hypothetical protein